MQIKLNRIWNLFRLHSAAVGGFLSLILIVMGVLGLIFANSAGIVLLIAGIIFFCLFIYAFPKEFIIEENRIEYCLKIYNRKIPYVKINCRIIYTEGEIEFIQNPIEKRFNVGHMIYKGPSYGECTRYVLFKPTLPKKHKFYGIPNFAQFQKDFQECSKKYIHK